MRMQCPSPTERPLFGRSSPHFLPHVIVYIDIHDSRPNPDPLARQRISKCNGEARFVSIVKTIDDTVGRSSMHARYGNTDEMSNSRRDDECPAPSIT